MSVSGGNERKGKNMEEYMIIDGGTGRIEEKKSVFIATIRPVSEEEEALKFIAEMKKKYWDARHNCSAYIVGDLKRFSDDGEPSGTAGKPMLDVLEGKMLSGVVTVVTRYFGGILLGTGGLVRAYQGAVNEGLCQCRIARKQEGVRFDIRTDYQGLGKIQYAASAGQVCILDTEYGENVVIHIVCEKSLFQGFVKKVTEVTAGKAEISEEEPVRFYQEGSRAVVI